MAGLPLKIRRFGFSASVSTSALAYVVTTFKFKSVTCSCFNCSWSGLSVVLMKWSAVPMRFPHVGPAIDSRAA